MSETGRRIDWEEARRRVHESDLALERAVAPDAERVEAVYRQRAELLAARRAVEAAPERTFPVLVVVLAGERYGIDLEAVAEVVPLVRCTSIPEAPPELLGVLPLRGEVRSVVDLARLLGLTPAEQRPRGYVVLMRSAGDPVGLRVDGVEEIAQVAEDSLTGNVDEKCASSCLKGLTPDHVMLLDAGALLARPVFHGASPGDSRSGPVEE